MSRCPSCGAQFAPGAGWCSQCYTARRTAEAVPARPVPLPAAPGMLERSSRWRKSPTTFGPMGRILATIGLLLPLAVMVVGGMVVTFAWAGALLWLVVVMPRALRDIWRAGRAPI